MAIINRATVVEIIKTGTFAVNDVIGTFLIPFQGRFKYMNGAVDTGPTGGDAIINYRLNGGAGELTGAERLIITNGLTEGDTTIAGGLNVSDNALCEVYYESGPNALVGVRIKIQFEEKRGQFVPIKEVTNADSPFTPDPRTDHTLLVDSTAGDTTIILPPIDELESVPAYDGDPIEGLLLAIQKTVSASNVIIDGFDVETVEGAATITLTEQWETVIVHANADGWHVIARTVTTERIQDVVGAMATDSATINFSYNDGAGTFTGDVEITTSVPFTEQGSDPSTPASGKVLLYAKNDNSMYMKDDAAVVTNLGAVSRSYLATDGTNTTTTLANTGLSVAVKASKKYAFECVLMVEGTVATDGIKIDFSAGSAGETYFRAEILVFDTALLLATQNDDLTDVATVATVTGAAVVIVRGAFEPSGAGTFGPRYALNVATGTLTIRQGSHLIIEET